MAAPMRPFTRRCSPIAATAISPNPISWPPAASRTRTSFDEHRRLLDLFARGEFAAFEELMTTHITNSGVVYAKALKVEALKVEASGVE